MIKPVVDVANERDFYLTAQADQMYDLYDSLDNMILLMSGGPCDLTKEQAAPVILELEKAREAARAAHQNMLNILLRNKMVAVSPLPVPTREEDIFKPFEVEVCHGLLIFLQD